jgi:hypothetical protein
MVAHPRILLLDSNDESAFGPMEALPHVSVIAAQLGKGNSANIDRIGALVIAEIDRRRILSEAAGQEDY